MRAHGHGKIVTIAEHRPNSHQAHLEWTPSRLVHWAQSIGSHAARLFERILTDKPHLEMSYRGCLGLMRLAKRIFAGTHGGRCRTCLAHTGACHYQSVKSILKNSLDLPVTTHTAASPPASHDCVRGSEYFN